MDKKDLYVFLKVFLLY